MDAVVEETIDPALAFAQEATQQWQNRCRQTEIRLTNALVRERKLRAQLAATQEILSELLKEFCDKRLGEGYARTLYLPQLLLDQFMRCAETPPIHPPDQESL